MNRWISRVKSDSEKSPFSEIYCIRSRHGNHSKQSGCAGTVSKSRISRIDVLYGSRTIFLLYTRTSWEGVHIRGPLCAYLILAIMFKLCSVLSRLKFVRRGRVAASLARYQRKVQPINAALLGVQASHKTHVCRQPSIKVIFMSPVSTSPLLPFSFCSMVVCDTPNDRLSYRETETLF